MKKSIFWAVFVGLVLAFSSAAFAQKEDQEEDDPLGGLGGILQDILQPETPETPQGETPAPLPTPQAPTPGGGSYDCGRADCDGDGRASTIYNGDDCDDGDANRYPGNIEVTDPYNVDEDCDPMTVGEKDNDEDGYVDALSCNIDQSGMLVCGTDCDDENPIIVPGAQICASATAVRICNGTGQTTRRAQGTSPWRIAQCSSVGESRCAGQPNRTGICTR